MKTLDEVIDQLTECHTNWARWSENSDIVDRSAVDDALSYLRMYKELADDSEAFAEWKENPPLTWEELLTMTGKPVWIEYNIKRKDRTLLAWCLVLIVLDEYMSVQTNAVAFRVKKSEIGTKWQAYRKERS